MTATTRPIAQTQVEAEREALAQDLVLAEEAGQGRDARRWPGSRSSIVQWVIGIFRHRPPMSLMSCSSWTAWITQPEPRKSRPLKKPWVMRWKMRRGEGADARARRTCSPSWRQRRVGQDALDVGLGEGDRGRQDRGEDADRGDHAPSPSGRAGEDRVRPGHEVDAGVDHRRGVDEGRHRRRALHRVGQPDVERELGALAHRARRR